MTVRESLATVTVGCKTMVDLDAVVARHGGFGAMKTALCPDCSAMEFGYEWESVKLRLRNTAKKSRRYDEEV